MNKIVLNRWVYVSIVFFVAIGFGYAADFARETYIFLGLGFAISALTFPLGLIGVLSAIAITLSGIATMGEGYLVASPVFAIAGWWQWYVIFPKLFANREKQKLD